MINKINKEIEELEEGCGRQDIEFMPFCGVTCHTQYPDELGLGVDLCSECKRKIEQAKKDKEIIQKGLEDIEKDLAKYKNGTHQENFVGNLCCECKDCKRLMKRLDKIRKQLGKPVI